METPDFRKWGQAPQEYKEIGKEGHGGGEKGREKKGKPTATLCGDDTIKKRERDLGACAQRAILKGLLWVGRTVCSTTAASLEPESGGDSGCAQQGREDTEKKSRKTFGVLERGVCGWVEAEQLATRDITTGPFCSFSNVPSISSPFQTDSCFEDDILPLNSTKSLHLLTKSSERMYKSCLNWSQLEN